MGIIDNLTYKPKGLEYWMKKGTLQAGLIEKAGKAIASLNVDDTGLNENDKKITDNFMSSVEKNRSNFTDKLINDNTLSSSDIATLNQHIQTKRQLDSKIGFAKEEEKKANQYINSMKQYGITSGKTDYANRIVENAEASWKGALTEDGSERSFSPPAVAEYVDVDAEYKKLYTTAMSKLTPSEQNDFANIEFKTIDATDENGEPILDNAGNPVRYMAYDKPEGMRNNSEGLDQAVAVMNNALADPNSKISRYQEYMGADYTEMFTSMHNNNIDQSYLYEREGVDPASQTVVQKVGGVPKTKTKVGAGIPTDYKVTKDPFIAAGVNNTEKNIYEGSLTGEGGPSISETYGPTTARGVLWLDDPDKDLVDGVAKDLTANTETFIQDVTNNTDFDVLTMSGADIAKGLSDPDNGIFASNPEFTAYMKNNPDKFKYITKEFARLGTGKLGETFKDDKYEDEDEVRDYRSAMEDLNTMYNEYIREGAQTNEYTISPNFKVIGKDGVTSKNYWDKDIKPDVLQDFGQLHVMEISRDPKTNKIAKGYSNLGDNPEATFKDSKGNALSPMQTQGYIQSYIESSKISPRIMPYADIASYDPALAKGMKEADLRKLNDKMQNAFIVSVPDGQGTMHRMLIENRNYKSLANWDRQTLSKNSKAVQSFSTTLRNIPAGGSDTIKMLSPNGKTVAIDIVRYKDGYKYSVLKSDGSRATSGKFRNLTSLHRDVNATVDSYK